MTAEKTDLETEKRELTKKRDRLRERIRAIEQDYRRGLDSDSQERAVQLENAEVLEGIARAAAEELQQIEKRLSDLTSLNRDD